VGGRPPLHERVRVAAREEETIVLKGPARTESRRFTFAKVKTKLAEPGERDLKAGFERLAKLLESSGELAEVQFDIVEGRTSDAWTLSLDRKTAAANNRAARQPDVRIIVSRTTWQEIAAQDRSPLDAYVSGKLRIRGDTKLARRLFKRAAGRGQTDLPL
jgi:putative sterol carrier protein